MNKLVVLAVLLVGCAGAQKQETQSAAGPSTPQKRIDQKWNATDKIDAPESAFFDVASGSIFVSNVSGTPNSKDKKGWISKLAVDGTVQKADFATGLNAPKGLRSHKGTLWVTDIDEVVSIDIATGKVLKRYKVKDAKFLNDIGVADDGTVYVSDMVANKIHKISGGKVSTFAEGADLESPNGLYVDGDRLVVAAWGTGLQKDFSTKIPGNLYWLDIKTKKKTNITKAPLGHLDGLEKTGQEVFLVSDWMAGKVFMVRSDGQVTQLLEGFKGAADIGWIPKDSVLLVPRMGENQVTAFQFPLN